MPRIKHAQKPVPDWGQLGFAKLKGGIAYFDSIATPKGLTGQSGAIDNSTVGATQFVQLIPMP